MTQQTHKIGGHYLVEGLDMQCRPCTVRVTLLRVLDKPNENGFDCVVRCEGVKVLDRLANLRNA